MANYHEITSEITEQITDVTNSITTYQASIADANEKIARLQIQLQGLEQLRTQAEQLVADKDKIDLNISLNVTTDANSEASVIRHTGSTSV